MQIEPPMASAPDDEKSPLRRCIVTRKQLPKQALLRFVVDPDGQVVPDIVGRLPGRGLWVAARRDVLAMAMAKNAFAKAAKRSLTVPSELAERTTSLVAARCLELIGLARRAGQAAMGFERVRDWLGRGQVGVLLAAEDGAADGRRKLKAAAQGVPAIELFTSAELTAALGREHVVHAAVAPGRLAQAIIAEAGRLAGLRGSGRVEETERK